MLAPTSTSTSTSTSTDDSLHRTTTASRGAIALLLIWNAFGVYVAIAIARGLSLRDDAVSLPALTFFALTAVLGSRLYLAASERWSHHGHDNAHAHS